ncbi:hypothetical protein [Kitasatospora terrestris]|uniref:Uncharacterized protein n=1 Tax=Kitasatospora terrestris TaxID=258051 RepID=A0ABP9DM02_9ACTN
MHSWIGGTDFGRYVPLPEAAVPTWGGEAADEWTGEYAAAFELPGHGDVVSLGGEPLSVTWLPGVSAFARWYSADDDGGLVAAVDPLRDEPGWEDVRTVELAPGRYRLQSRTLVTATGDEFLLDRLLPVRSTRRRPHPRSGGTAVRTRRVRRCGRGRSGRR